MSDSKYAKMRHALGVHEYPRARRGVVDMLSPRWKKPYRNHFVAGEDDAIVWRKLVEEGFARLLSKGNEITGGCPAFAVTDAGRTAALAGIIFKRTWGYGTPVNP